MSAGYQLSRTAEDELGEILFYVAEQSGVDRALHVHVSFVEAFEHLAEMPASGSKRTEITGDRVRWWRVFDWIVLYDLGEFAAHDPAHNTRSARPRPHPESQSYRSLTRIEPPLRRVPGSCTIGAVLKAPSAPRIPERFT